ncbi:MAG: 16S rRNA (adenine(1518)-N(6)/adenine(1519)-N(6))-dimethyltransferase RsmA [Acidimicrobiia bacterium]|nr:16S rRNA (adenine(1518)-N(6)/adenine(1519)-N(6))-dimethyltransferase RsmA [Acidimicrobiia bacterium]
MGTIDRSRYLTRRRVRDLLERHGLAPSRALGQNFLCDPNTVDKIGRLAGVGPGDRVIEIGAGLGSLTVGLAATGAEVVALEVDRHLLAALAETVDGLGVEVHHADARTFEWEQRLRGARWHVVANLPYNIATPLILDLLATRPELARWLVMVQREAGERLVAEPGSRIYGIPSVLTAYWATSRIVGAVGPDLFLPRPKVESVLVAIERHEASEIRAGVSYEQLTTVVRAGFGRRRKMIRRSLADYVTEEQLEALGIPPTARAEELDLDGWCAVARLIG